jgi:hypothetical protein
MSDMDVATALANQIAAGPSVWSSPEGVSIDDLTILARQFIRLHAEVMTARRSDDQAHT